MSEAQRPAAAGRRTAQAPLIVSLAVVLGLATFGGFAAGFGVMTDCTNTYSCTVTDCRPCQAADTWLDVGWIAQGVLLLVGAVLAVLGGRRIQPRAVRLGALALGAVSVTLFAATTFLAVRSF